MASDNSKILVFLVLLFASLSAAGQTNRALLVAIDKYPEGSGWAEIHAINDIELLTHIAVYPPSLGRSSFLWYSSIRPFIPDNLPLESSRKGGGNCVLPLGNRFCKQ